MSWYKQAIQNQLGLNDRDSTQDRLKAAVESYLKDKNPAKPAYYINPRLRHYEDFDINNPEHVEKELGKDYDKSFEIKRGNHPSFLTCRSAASDLAQYLKNLGFKARVVAGWYGHADKDYSTGKSPGLDDAWPPDGFGTKPEEHWWVEAEGYYIDISNAQFHPRNPSKQTPFTLKDKQEAIKDQDYYPVRRFPLGRAVPLPDGAAKMVQQISSIKKFQAGESSNRNDLYGLCEWISKYAKKYGLTEEQTSDIIASLKAETEEFYFADVRKLSRIFGEAFDEIPESNALKREDQKAKPFKPVYVKPNSMGTVKLQYGKLYLSSSYDIKYNDRFTKLKDVIKNAWTLPNRITFSPTKYESVNNYGVMLFSAWCDFQMEGYQGNPFELCLYGKLNESETKAIKDVFNAIKAAGFKLAFF